MAQKDVTKMTMPEIKIELETLSGKYNSDLVAEKYDKLPAITKRMDELVSEYGKQAKAAFLASIDGKENPLTLAIMNPEYKVAVYKDKTDKESGAVTRDVGEKVKLITFNDLNTKFASNFRFKNWKAYVDQLNLRMCLWTANELGLSATDRKKIESEFAMKNGGADIDLQGTPTSNTQILKQLRTVCHGIYGEADIQAKIVSHDVSYLQMCYTKMGRELRHVSTLNSSKLSGCILQVMNRVLTNSTYEVDYKKHKDGEKSNAKTVEEKPAKAPKAKKAAKKVEAQPEAKAAPKEESVA